MKKVTTEQDRIDREAADWVVKWEDREREPVPKEQSRWFSWLQRSPRHVQSYFGVADLYERLGRMDPDNKIDVDEWLADRQAPVVSIATRFATQSGDAKIAASGSRWLWRAAAASLAVVVAGIALWGLGVFEAHSYRTAVGQQTVNRLADGSVMNLNTRSRAKVRFSDSERVVELEGEALFTVAHDPARPFFVRTHGAVVRAIGTKFNVYEQAGETRVAVMEGAVQVTPGSSTAALLKPYASLTPADASTLKSALPEAIALSAGESASVSRGRVAKERSPDVEAQVAWQHQKLVFEDASLAEVAAEFNRYNAAQFRVEGPVGQSKRLSGTFDALHPDSLLLYLQKDAAVTVQPAGDDFIVRGR